MKKYLIILAFSLLAVYATNVYAQGTQSGGSPIKIDNPFNGGGDLQTIFKSIVDNILLPIGGVVAVLSFIWVGFMFVMAQGDPTKLTTARTALWYTAIGTLILLGASAILTVLGNTVDQLKS